MKTYDPTLWSKKVHKSSMTAALGCYDEQVWKIFV